MTILLSDPRVAAVPVRGAGAPLVRLDPEYGPARARVRRGLAQRLAAARDALPAGLGLRVVEGHRPVSRQLAIIAEYPAELRRLHPGLPGAELHRCRATPSAPSTAATPSSRHRT